MEREIDDEMDGDREGEGKSKRHLQTQKRELESDAHKRLHGAIQMGQAWSS